MPPGKTSVARRRRPRLVGLAAVLAAAPALYEREVVLAQTFRPPRTLQPPELPSSSN